MSRQNILLDLDQTLISAESTDDFDAEKYKDYAPLFEFENMDGYYIVFERPGLQKFLDYIFSEFNVSVWTAATKSYALFVIEKIILKNKDRKIDYILFSDHCTYSSNKGKGDKDLDMLCSEWCGSEYNKYNTVILDDNEDVYETNPNNCIIAKPFFFTQKDSVNDTFLTTLIPHLTSMKEDMKKCVKHPAINVNKLLSN